MRAGEGVGLRMPDLAALSRWVGEHASVDWQAQAGGAFALQRSDGSWGEADSAQRRILPTLWMAKALAELGYAADSRWSQACRFLAVTAHTDGGEFSVDGSHEGVLSCPVVGGSMSPREDVLADPGLGVGEAASRLGISRVALSRVLHEHARVSRTWRSGWRQPGWGPTVRRLVEVA